jgi:hydrogenase/urease accessory protein HupE
VHILSDYSKLFLVLCTLLCLIPQQSNAHSLPLTSVTVNIEENLTRVTVVVHTGNLGGSDPKSAIATRLHLRLDGVPFRPSETSLAFDEAAQTISWEGREPRRASAVAIDTPLFADDPGDSTMVLVYRDGRMVDRAVVSREWPSAILAETALAVSRRFIQMGIHHILSGPDHVLFVLGLLLVQGTLRALLGVVTAFTLAHSITLSMTALDIGSLPPGLVEPIIALSIVAVGIENLVHRRVYFEGRLWLAFGFGFFHGFGFAGALGEAGVPHDAVAWSLAAFNIGVEIGQACIVIVAVPLLRMFGRLSPALAGNATRYASIGIAAAGVVWFVERLQL